MEKLINVSIELAVAYGQLTDHFDNLEACYSFSDGLKISVIINHEIELIIENGDERFLHVINSTIDDTDCLEVRKYSFGQYEDYILSHWFLLCRDFPEEVS